MGIKMGYCWKLNIANLLIKRQENGMNGLKKAQKHLPTKPTDK